ncbi:MAG TPA: dihydropteroate synthase [Vicinamibacterales bacterium]|jgi:dihydropteroate synthase|nr:dihydropteroate synthase [Vicinamibacterales bacterium]
MGIVNVTPDSFAEITRLETRDAIELALLMEAQGADLLDIGGESTRPGADPVPAPEELSRILPVFEGLAGRVRVPLSVDTRKASVARAALRAGAVMVNDTSGGDPDDAVAKVVADSGAALIIMHARGDSKDMYAEAVYRDVLEEVEVELRVRIERARSVGVPLESLVVDPGIGFAKRASQSYGVLGRLPELTEAIDRPVLVGPSRKSYLREALGDIPAAARDWGTAAAVTAAVLAGAHILRVHAVPEMVQVTRVAEAIRQAGQSDARSTQGPDRGIRSVSDGQ